MNTLLVNETADEAVWGELTKRAKRVIGQDAVLLGRERRWGAFASSRDLQEGFDGGLGLLALIEMGCGLRVAARNGQMLEGVSTGARGIGSIVGAACRLRLDAIALSCPATLGATHFVRLAVLDLFHERDVALFDCSNGSFIDRLSLQREMLLGGVDGQA